MIFIELNLILTLLLQVSRDIQSQEFLKGDVDSNKSKVLYEISLDMRIINKKRQLNDVTDIHHLILIRRRRRRLKGGGAHCKLFGAIVSLKNHIF